MERAIEATTRLRASLERAVGVLREDPGCIVTDAAGPEERRERRFLAPVGAPVGAGAVVQQVVSIEFGTVTVDEAAAHVPISWHPVAHERVLPDFDGVLAIEPDVSGNTRLALRGSYQVPLGPVGRFGDSVVGRRVARRSLSDLLEEMAGRLDRAVDRRGEAAVRGPAPYAVDLRELHGLEHQLDRDPEGS